MHTPKTSTFLNLCRIKGNMESKESKTDFFSFNWYTSYYRQCIKDWRKGWGSNTTAPGSCHRWARRRQGSQAQTSVCEAGTHGKPVPRARPLLPARLPLRRSYSQRRQESLNEPGPGGNGWSCTSSTPQGHAEQTRTFFYVSLWDLGFACYCSITESNLTMEKAQFP